MAQALKLTSQPFSARSYDALRPLDEAKGSVHEHIKGTTTLFNKILEHNVHRLFTLHLVHKHFSLEDGQIIVHETIMVPQPPYTRFQICSPRVVDPMTKLWGFRYKVETETGDMVPYEYTTDEIEDEWSKYPAFITDFAKTLVGLKLQDGFGLALRESIPLGRCPYIHDIEIPSLNVVLSMVKLEPLVYAIDKQEKVFTEWSFSGGDIGKEATDYVVKDLLAGGGFNASMVGLRTTRRSILPHSEGHHRSNTISFEKDGKVKACGLEVDGQDAKFMQCDDIFRVIECARQRIVEVSPRSQQSIEL